MAELLTSAQMRAIEAAAIESGAVTGLELMERAGRGVVEAILAEWPELSAGGRAVVLCGPGNNGGDGFVVARLLRERGWEVEVFLYGDPARMPADARVNYERWRGMGEVGAIVAPQDDGDLLSFLAQKKDQIVVDALFGTGLVRPILDPLLSVLRWLDDTMDEYVSHYVAVDIPSGLCADSGRLLQRWLRKVDLTVTFQSAKLGHFLADGPSYCGRLVIKDIGLKLIARPASDRTAMVDGHHPGLRKHSWGHKFLNGSVFLLGGPSGRGGAARLAARGALRIGAGVVTVGCPSAALVENAARLDAVMLRVVEDGGALEAVLEDGRIGAVCLGPGLGTGAREVGLVAAALGGRGEPLQRRGEPRPTGVVLDADALTILSREAGLFGALHGACVLTPHAGEFARLFPDIAERLAAPAVAGPAYSKVDATREAAARAGCVVLFKGADTVIAAPDGRCAVNSAQYERAAPWLATAGSGDVLAGFIAGLMARGFLPFDAACTGAWLHVDCAREFGPGLIAEDLPEMLPAVFRRLGV